MSFALQLRLEIPQEARLRTLCCRYWTLDLRHCSPLSLVMALSPRPLLWTGELLPHETSASHINNGFHLSSMKNISFFLYQSILESCLLILFYSIIHGARYPSHDLNGSQKSEFVKKYMIKSLSNYF